VITIHQRYRRTDGQTDGRTDAKRRHHRSIAKARSGKNVPVSLQLVTYVHRVESRSEYSPRVTSWEDERSAPITLLLLLLLLMMMMMMMMTVPWCRDRSTVRRDEMLKNTYRNLFLLKRVNETSSVYRRDKFLNDWVVS